MPAGGGEVRPTPIEFGNAERDEIMARGIIKQLGGAAIAGTGGDPGWAGIGGGEGGGFATKIMELVEAVNVFHQFLGKAFSLAAEVSPACAIPWQVGHFSANAFDTGFGVATYFVQFGRVEKRRYPAGNLPTPLVLPGKGAEDGSVAARPPAGHQAEHLAPCRSEQNVGCQIGLGPSS